VEEKGKGCGMKRRGGGGGDGEAGRKTRQKGGGSVRALCHDACPCTCARPMPTHFCYAPYSVAGTDLEAVNSTEKQTVFSANKPHFRSVVRHKNRYGLRTVKSKIFLSRIEKQLK